MNPSDHTTDSTWDAMMRTCWHAAQAQLSPAIRAQLHRRRIAATSGARVTRRGMGWRRLAAACGVLGLVWALGGMFGPQWPERPVSPPAAVLLAAPDAADPFTPADVLDAFDSITLTALDEDPDFLAWLASDEVGLLAAH